MDDGRRMTNDETGGAVRSIRLRSLSSFDGASTPEIAVGYSIITGTDEFAFGKHAILPE